MLRRSRPLRAAIGVAAILALSCAQPGPSAAEPEHTTFTGGAWVLDHVHFATTGSLGLPRDFHSATLLNDGRVLVAGGVGRLADGTDTPYASAELYDPATGAWTPTASMAFDRRWHTATLLNDGRVLVAGGDWSGGGPGRASAELYDPVTGTWSPTGSMAEPRYNHSATLLEDGRVLVAGGISWTADPSHAELYDPVTGTWSPTGSMAVGRNLHTATLLGDGRVLVAGGYGDGRFRSAELYDPATGVWSPTGSMGDGRVAHTATLLGDGKVLVAGEVYAAGASAELYDPATGVWSPTGSMGQPRWTQTATLLGNGSVLVAGGNVLGVPLTSAELYDPSGGTWSLAGSMTLGRSQHTATLLQSGMVLITGGEGYAGTDSTELGTLAPGNLFGATLTLPGGWLNGPSIPVEFRGTTGEAPLAAGALSDDGTTWGDWIPASENGDVSTTLPAGAEGRDRPVYLRLRDANGTVATVVTGTVSLDRTPPTSTIQLWPLHPILYMLEWTGSDALSGIASYEVQGFGVFPAAETSLHVRGNDWGWTGFRVRATDAAGNVQPWPEDDEPPTGALSINDGATVTYEQGVALSLPAQDNSGTVALMSFSHDGLTWHATDYNNWEDWQPYSGGGHWTLEPGDGPKVVYARLRDTAGNFSATISSTIVLDTSPAVHLPLVAR